MLTLEKDRCSSSSAASIDVKVKVFSSNERREVIFWRKENRV